MTQHSLKDRLSAYLDGIVPLGEKGDIESHLTQCNECRSELQEIKDIKSRLSQMSHLKAPLGLLKKLEQAHAHHPSWLKRIRLRIPLFSRPLIWRPVGAIAIAAAVLGLVFLKQSFYKRDYIELDSLLAAHHRYQAEALVPSADMAQSNYSLRLASYDPNGN